MRRLCYAFLPVFLAACAPSAHNPMARTVERGRLIGILPVFRDREGRELHFALGTDVGFDASADGVLSAREPIANWFQVRPAQVGKTVVTVSAPGGPRVGVSIDVIR